MPPEPQESPGTWLLALLRRHLGGPEPLESPPAGIEKIAAAEGLAGLAAEYVLPGTPEHGALLRRRRHQFAFAAKLAGVQKTLGRELAAAGCEALLLKGAALLEGPYAGAAGRRPLSDLDLLIHPYQSRKVTRVLERLGLVRLDPGRWRGDGFEIDLHRDLLGMEGQGLASLSPFRIDQESLFWRSLPAKNGGPGLRIADPVDQVLHLAIHGQKHAFCRLVWLLDLALLLPSVEPGELLARAKEWRAERALAAALALLADPLGQEIPSPLGRLAGQLDRCEKAWLAAIRRRRPGRPVGLGRVIAGFALPGLGLRLRYWWAILCPASPVLASKYPRASRWQAGLLHLRTSIVPRLGEAVSALAFSWERGRPARSSPDAGGTPALPAKGSRHGG
jgi:hypothetical protein